MKTSELKERALDWAVAKCEEKLRELHFARESLRYIPGQFSDEEPYTPSTDWAQGGPIIEREKIELTDNIRDRMDEGCWAAHICKTKALCGGRTALIAAMRCYVASKLGDEVDVPAELI